MINREIFKIGNIRVTLVGFDRIAQSDKVPVRTYLAPHLMIQKVPQGYLVQHPMMPGELRLYVPKKRRAHNPLKILEQLQVQNQAFKEKLYAIRLTVNRRLFRIENSWSISDLIFHRRAHSQIAPVVKLKPSAPISQPVLTKTISEYSTVPPVAQRKKVRPILFSDVMNRRKTRYRAARDLTLAELSQYLNHVFGVKRPESKATADGKKNYPSAGGLYESRLFLLISRIDHLLPGLYGYDGSTWKLKLVKNLDQIPIELIMAPYRLTDQNLQYPPGPQVQVFIMSDLRRLRSVYGDLSYKLALTNASILMSHCLLWAEAMAFSTVPLGTYPSQILHQTLEVDEVELPLMCQFCMVGTYL